MRFLFLIFFTVNLCFSLRAAEEDQKNPAIIVNIDNPQFRRLIVAIPPFILDDSVKSSETSQLSLDAKEYLIELLNFTGLFRITADAMFIELLPKVQKAYQNSNSRFLSEPGKKNLTGIYQDEWKAIGIESLTIGTVQQQEEKVSIELRTLDVQQGKLLLGKRYWVTESNYREAMRAYADWLLKTYTGKGGIFKSRLTFVGKVKKGSPKQIFISDFDGSNKQQITFGNTPHLSPDWSPDGRYVTYTSFEDGNPDLFMYDVETKSKSKLSGSKGLNSGGNWSPEGDYVAFTGSKNGDADIYTIRPNGTDKRLLITGHGLDVDPSFSPDKKWIAFVSGRFGNPHIFIGTLKWENQRVRVVADRRITYAGWYNATPDWAPDSEKLAFAGYDRDIDRFDIFIVNPNGSQLERLTLKNGDNENPSWSPNGQLIAFQSNRIPGQNKKARPQIYLMNRDGSGQRELKLDLYEAQTPAWSRNLE